MGHAFQSQMRRWDVVAGLCQSIGAKTMVEVGCKEGRTTGHVLATCPDTRVIAIDPWKRQEASDDPTRETYQNWDFEEIERTFWEHVGEHNGRCTMLRMTSEEAADRFNTERDPEQTLIYTSTNGMNGAEFLTLPPVDLVFIDAMHDYESVMQDISMWWPKVRDGGYLCGHDYQHSFPGVMRAIADCFPLLRVGVCPDSVWVVCKDETLQLREAA